MPAAFSCSVSTFFPAEYTVVLRSLLLALFLDFCIGESDMSLISPEQSFSRTVGFTDREEYVEAEKRRMRGKRDARMPQRRE